MAKPYFIYILANSRNIVIYTGVTNDLVRRVYEHKNDFVEGFTRKYRVHKLVYYEVCENALSAINPLDTPGFAVLIRFAAEGGLKPGVLTGLILSGALSPDLEIGVRAPRTYRTGKTDQIVEPKEKERFDRGHESGLGGALWEVMRLVFPSPGLAGAWGSRRIGGALWEAMKGKYNGEVATPLPLAGARNDK